MEVLPDVVGSENRLAWWTELAGLAAPELSSR
jgi:hypothetical protein